MVEQYVLSTTTITLKRTGKAKRKVPTLSHLTEREGVQGGKIVVYRRYFLRLLAYPKCLRDQLVFELPTLQAFRTGEVSSFHGEWADMENGDLQVLDSKKLELFTLPMHPTVAKHINAYMKETGITEGILIKALPGAPHIGRKAGSTTIGMGMSITNLEKIWAKYCHLLEIPVMSPRYGRAYWLCMEHFVKQKPLYYTMTIMRHESMDVHQKYVARLIDYPAIKDMFNQGELPPFLSLCVRSGQCPLSAPNCHCRMFQPKLQEVEVNQ